MTAQKGADLLVKVDDGTGNFQTACGIRSKSISFNTETVDVTDSCSAGRWRELLAGAGIRSATITGSGIFKDTEMEDDIRRYFFDGVMFDAQFIIPDFGTLQGPWAITSLDYAGEYNGEVTFSMTFESAGQQIWTADSTSAPRIFNADMWAIATGSGSAEADVNIITLPQDGGDTITALEYTTNGGASWSSLPGTPTSTGLRTITLGASGTDYGVAIRATNSTGSGPMSVAKPVTSGS
ncbi:major tail protein [Desulfofustis phage LS06-2018-MD02]|jgi:TP901-1 family phage major tail protein|nr:major tail protein [Desulfofustis phage LS06-2018-MD02]